MEFKTEQSIIKHYFHHLHWGTGIRGLKRGMANLPKVTRSYLWSKTKLGDPRWAWGKQVHECDIFPSVQWHCWLGDRNGIRPVKNWMLVCWWWCF